MTSRIRAAGVRPCNRARADPDGVAPAASRPMLRRGEGCASQEGCCLDGPTFRVRRPEHRHPARRLAGRAHAQPATTARREPPAWLAEARASLPSAGRYLAFEQDGRAGRHPAVARVDPDRPLAGRRRALRRRHGLPPSCPGRRRGGRRARARRPLAQRHLGQRPPRRVEPADRRRRARHRPPRAVLPGHRVRGRRGRRARPRWPSKPAVAIVLGRHGRHDRGPVAQGRHGQDHHRPHADRRVPARRASTSSRSTSTRRATCRTTSTSRPTRRRRRRRAVRRRQGSRAPSHDGIVPGDADPGRGRALAVGQDGPRADPAQGAQGRAQGPRRRS